MLCVPPVTLRVEPALMVKLPPVATVTLVAVLLKRMPPTLRALSTVATTPLETVPAKVTVAPGSGTAPSQLPARDQLPLVVAIQVGVPTPPAKERRRPTLLTVPLD